MIAAYYTHQPGTAFPSHEQVAAAVQATHAARDAAAQTGPVPTPVFRGSLVTLTMTTCKRLDKFVTTLTSVLRCIQDLEEYVAEVIIVDDQSSDEDREKMQALFPWATFVFKTPEQKGHVRSANMVLKMARTPYVLHIEDDWEFWVQYPFLAHMLDVLRSNPSCLQVLFNQNYSETPAEYTSHGGVFAATPSGNAYVVHEHHNQRLAHPNCAYWPHFSLRPGLWNVETLRERVGFFNPAASHFEMEYGQRYTGRGYVTAFLPGMVCTHLGKLTNREGENAYSLNGEPQFQAPRRSVLDTFLWVCINLTRRPDRYKGFCDRTRRVSTVVHRGEAVDGLEYTLTADEERVFSAGDYNLNAGIVGCALSHLKLWQLLLQLGQEVKGLVVFEDDYAPPNEGAGLEHIVARLVEEPDSDEPGGDDDGDWDAWDILVLSHHLTPSGRAAVAAAAAAGAQPDDTTECVSAGVSLASSYGGLFAYLIRPSGALKMLQYIKDAGMTNAIDTMVQLAADRGVKVRYLTVPHGSSPMANQDPSVDSDIQHCTVACKRASA